MNSVKDISAKTNTASLQSSVGISLLGAYELTKPRLSLLSVFTASLGYLVHDPLVDNLSVFLALTFGTAFSAAGAAALNQWMERKEDALMPRTAARPIPARLISSQFALSLRNLSFAPRFGYPLGGNQRMVRRSHLSYPSHLFGFLHTP